jgi:hypothetical protein
MDEWLEENPEIVEKYFSPNDGSGIADQIKGLKKQLESADLAFYKSLTLEDFEKWLVYLHKNK